MNENKIKIAYSPLNHNGNKYFYLIQKCIEKESNIEIVDYNEPIKNIGYFNDIDIVFFNCYEDIKSYNNVFGKIKRFLIFINRIISIKILKLKKIKIVYTLHNRISHELTNRKYSKYLSKILCKNSDKIVILCDDTKEVLKEYISDNEIEKKVIKIPHPSYLGAYKEENRINIYKDFNIKKSSMVLLFLGMIRPYKNIELILKAAEKTTNLDIHYVIAGGGKDPEYVKKIIDDSSRYSNISILPRFIKDDEMVGIIKQADLLIFPYDNSSLNSGSVILAFSYGKTVICPKIGTIKEFSSNITFNYEYNSEQEHEINLLDQIHNSYYLYKNNKDIFDKMGKDALLELQEKCSVDIISKKYKYLIESVLRGN